MSALTGGMYRIAPGALAGPPSAAGLTTTAPLRLNDTLDGGLGRIAGTLKVEGQNARRRVQLLDAITCRLVRETFSDANGAYEFRWIALGREYLVIARDDYYRQHDAVVHDRITPEPMPT